MADALAVASWQTRPAWESLRLIWLLRGGLSAKANLLCLSFFTASLDHLLFCSILFPEAFFLVMFCCSTSPLLEKRCWLRQWRRLLMPRQVCRAEDVSMPASITVPIAHHHQLALATSVPSLPHGWGCCTFSRCCCRLHQLFQMKPRLLTWLYWSPVSGNPGLWCVEGLWLHSCSEGSRAVLVFHVAPSAPASWLCCVEEGAAWGGHQPLHRDVQLVRPAWHFSESSHFIMATKAEKLSC